MKSETAIKPLISIIVKALNEEDHIAGCLSAAVREAHAVQGEVILVDSLSRDRTIEIARTFPVRIVQFKNAVDCGCGAAVQLGYQYAQGEYIYVLDADMVLQPGFLRTALDALMNDSRLAGVGGRLVDTQVLTAADKRRVAESARLVDAVPVKELGGGGLYRRVAIEEVAYLAHRGLPAFEESELGIRLRSAGWALLRLPQAAVSHTGHKESNWAMLARLWKNRRAHATGMFLRSALGRKWWWRACLKQWHVVITLLMHFGLGMAAWILAREHSESYFTLLLVLELVVWCGILTILAFRKRSFGASGFSIFSWHFFAVAAAIGFWRKPDNPFLPIASRVLV